jgi:hypothetical protein
MHWESEPSAERKDFAAHLVRELTENIVGRHGRPDFIAVVGDLAARGRMAEYESLGVHLFNPLRARLRTPLEPPFFFVAGNHDLDRDIADSLNSKRIAETERPEAVDALLSEPVTRDLYLSPFSQYQTFVRSFNVLCEDPLTWATAIDSTNGPISVAGINTAWSCYHSLKEGATSERGRLLVGLPQIPTQQAGVRPVLRVLLMHHPLEWLATDICGQATRELTTGFDLIVTGHVHSPFQLRFMTSPSGESLFAPCPVLYDRPYSDSIEFARGVAVGELDTDSSQMRLYYYRYSTASGNRLLPYSDVYPSGAGCFSVTLGHASEQLAADRQEFFETVTAFEVPGAAAPTDRAGSDHTDGQRLQQIFDRALALQEAISPIPVLGPVEASVLAYQLASRALLRINNEQALPDLADLKGLFGALAVVDAEAVRHLYANLQLRGTIDIARVPPLSDCPATAVFVLLWGLAQYVLAFDDPTFLPADGSVEARPSTHSAGNVIDVTLNEARSELVFRLRTRSRDEFHHIAESRYTIDSFLGRVDELWRAAGLFAPPFRVVTGFPNWDARPVDSFQIAVDPKPVTRLLMGQALYGGRRHIWLRELLQNARDAVNMRWHDDSRDLCRVQVTREHDHLVRVSDDGVGMTRPHVLAFLATLGRSGWRSLGREDGREDAPRMSLVALVLALHRCLVLPRLSRFTRGDQTLDRSTG